MNDPDIEAIGDALRFLAARAPAEYARLPRDPLAVLGRLTARVVRPLPDGWALRLEQYDDFSGYTVFLGHSPIDGAAEIWEAEAEGGTINAAVSAAIDNIGETGFPDASC